MSKICEIGGVKIGGNNKAFIIAEISANHNGVFENAVKLIKEAKKAGVDAVKLQTYTADTITINCDNEYFQIEQGTLWDGKTFYDLYKEAYTPWEWQPKLMRIAEEEGLICFSSPFDKSSVDFLEDLNVPAYKVASFEITDIPLIEYIASKGKPIIISTGIAGKEDIELAIQTCKNAGNDKIILLKCTSAYPAPYEDMNLKMIPDLAEKFNVISGLSDHTLGTAIPVAAIALGAKVVEKHITLNRADGGPDAEFSLEPNELKEMVVDIRAAESALGKVSYELSDKMKKSRNFSRSLFIVKDVKLGEKLSADNVRSIRPGYGLHTKHLNEIIGKKVSVDIKAGSPLRWDMISKTNK